MTSYSPELPPGEPSPANTAESMPAPAPTPEPADPERAAALRRVLMERTREARARVERRGDYDALVVRGEKIRHQLYLRVTVVLAVVAFLSGLGLGMSAQVALATGVVVAAIWAAVWLFLTLTGGEEFDLIEAHEDGRVTVTRTGHLVETRGNVLRIGVPIAVLVLCAYFGLTLAAAIANPQAPACNAPPSLVSAQPNACLAVIDPGGSGDIGAVLTTDQVKTLDLALRTVWFVGVLVLTTVSLFFLRAMLTGRHFLNVAPVKWPRSSEADSTGRGAARR